MLKQLLKKGFKLTSLFKTSDVYGYQGAIFTREVHPLLLFFVNKVRPFLLHIFTEEQLAQGFLFPEWNKDKIMKPVSYFNSLILSITN